LIIQRGLFLGRTESIKQRAIYVYLSSEGHKERWQRRAEKVGVSISKFVTEHVENSLRQEEEPDFKSRSDLWKENSELKKQVTDLAKKCRLLETVTDKLEHELRRYRSMPFLEENFEGVRNYDKELIEILKSSEIVSDEQILSRLGIACTASDEIRAVSKQLEALEAYGLVKPSPRGWKWTG
jgi:vacuolar-type H+-ATPase subunit I/STV1